MKLLDIFKANLGQFPAGFKQAKPDYFPAVFVEIKLGSFSSTMTQADQRGCLQATVREANRGEIKANNQIYLS